MKITVKQLKKIVKEEVERSLMTERGTVKVGVPWANRNDEPQKFSTEVPTDEYECLCCGEIIEVPEGEWPNPTDHTCPDGRYPGPDEFAPVDEYTVRPEN